MTSKTRISLSRVIDHKKSSIVLTPCFSSRSCEVQAVLANNSVNPFQPSASIKSKTFFDAILSIELAMQLRIEVAITKINADGITFFL